MKTAIFYLFLLALASCSTHDRISPNGQMALETQRTGAQVAAELTRRYNDTRVNCGSDSKPAFLCSGIDLRGTRASPLYDSWNPGPVAQRVGGVSFSYLRRDYKFKRLAYNYTNGFILYPVLNKPIDKIQIHVLCFFPIDGDSDHRPEGGCGATPNKPMSASCNSVGVTTGEQWAAHYNQYGEDPGGRGGCSMDVRDSINIRAGPNFYQGMIGGRLISPKAFNVPNDLKHQVWAQDIPATLPIEAFFYVLPAGLPNAQYDQDNFYKLTGITLPIISMKLPATLSDNATFEFVPGVQVVPVDDSVLAAPKILEAAGPTLDITALTAGARVQVNDWPLIALGQYVWLRLKGTKADGSSLTLNLWAPPTSKTNTTWIRQGYYDKTVPYNDLKDLKDASVVTLEFKAGLGASQTESEATTFPLRTYTVNAPR